MDKRTEKHSKIVKRIQRKNATKFVMFIIYKTLNILDFGFS